MKNADMPAMPNHYMDLTPNGGELHCDQQGLTKREHFASMAMQGILPVSDLMDLDVVAKRAVRMADELLKELESNK